MPMTVALHRKLEEVDPQLRGVLFAILEEIEQQREETVTKREFNELRDIVGELAEAQKQTEKRINELAEAQKQTEKRLDRLEVVVGELTEAQKQLTVRMDELAEAQKQTERRLNDLIGEHVKTRADLRGLSTLVSITVGFVLEDRAYKSLPALLKRDFGLEVQGELVRKYVRDNKGEQIEVNIVGEATRNGERFMIIGESKAQLSKNKIEAFLNKKLKRVEGVFAGELFPIIVTHMISQPDAAEFALQQGIKRVYYSYEFSS
jgi:DNA repair exonuclease SbcCD ATPase subunit